MSEQLVEKETVSAYDHRLARLAWRAGYASPDLLKNEIKRSRIALREMELKNFNGFAVSNGAQGEPATAVFSRSGVDGMIFPRGQQLAANLLETEESITIRSTSTITKLRRVRITYSDIWNGVRQASDACPVWRAIWRDSGFRPIAVHPATVKMRLGAHGEIALPQKVTRWIYRFDAFAGPQILRLLFFRPFSFELEVPA